jgi:hypothetical protein
LILYVSCTLEKWQFEDVAKHLDGKKSLSIMRDTKIFDMQVETYVLVSRYRLWLAYREALSSKRARFMASFAIYWAWAFRLPFRSLEFTL